MSINLANSCPYELEAEEIVIISNSVCSTIEELNALQNCKLLPVGFNNMFEGDDPVLSVEISKVVVATPLEIVN